MKKNNLAKLGAGLATVAIGVGLGAGSTVLAAEQNNTSSENKVEQKNFGEQMEQKNFGQKIGRMMKGKGGFVGQWMDENVTKTVTYLSNGVEETIIGKNAETTAKIQKMVDMKADKIEDKAPENVEMKVEKIDGGVKITRTSSDTATAEKIIARAKSAELMKKLKDANVDIKSQIKTSTVETANGVQITVSSDNADVQSLIKLMSKSMPENGGMGIFGGGKGPGPRQ